MRAFGQGVTHPSWAFPCRRALAASPEQGGKRQAGQHHQGALGKLEETLQQSIKQSEAQTVELTRLTKELAKVSGVPADKKRKAKALW